MMRLTCAIIGGALLACAAGARCEIVELVPMGAGHGVVYGNVQTVLDGQCTGTAVYDIPRDALLAGLGAGAVTPDPAAQGEALVLDGTCHVKSVDAATGYATQSTTGTFVSGFVAGLSRDAKPVARYTVTSSTIGELYSNLVGRHGPYLAVLGAGQFQSVEASAIKRAPCYGEPILGDNLTRYFHDKIVYDEGPAYFVGLVMRSPADATSETATVFYVNPRDTSTTSVQSHSHVALLSTLDGVEPSAPASTCGKVKEIAHMLTQSVVREGCVAVFELPGGAPFRRMTK